MDHRVVPLGPVVVNTLEQWKGKCPKGELDLVFPTQRGTVQSYANIRRRGWLPTLEAADITDDADNLKYTRLHCLRHWFASWCLNSTDAGGLELPAMVVQERLGHATLSMTTDRYGHLLPRRDKDAAQAKTERKLFAAVTGM